VGAFRIQSQIRNPESKNPKSPHPNPPPEYGVPGEGAKLFAARRIADSARYAGRQSLLSLQYVRPCAAPPQAASRRGEGDFAGGARDWREKADGHPMNRDIDQLIEQLKSRLPDVEVDQLEPTEGGGEEDGLWFFRMPGSGQEIAVETEAGALPFTLEHDDMRSSAEAETAGSVDEAVEKVVAYLSAARPA
jgi:hypothetical protein